jgi:CDGSH-type Zn-finger protein
MITVRLRRNGPYIIEGGDVRVVDADGVERQPSRLPVALCRCGASAIKPFCDGSHARVGFASDADALRGASRKEE